MIHFFGDSFTYGQGCTPEHEYYKQTYNGTQKTWIELVSEYIGSEFKNYGRPGISNQQIIDTIIEKLKSINENDIVVISRTHDSRFIIPSIDVPNINQHHNVTIGMFEEGITQYGEMSQEYYDGVKSYIENVFVPNLDAVTFRYDSIFKHLKYYFESRNIKVVEWNVDDHILTEDGRAKYPIISDEYPNIKDSHWSWRGHIEFFKYMKSNLL